MKKYTAIIVDDDDENIKLLKFYIARHCPDIEVVGEADCVTNSISLVNEYRPQILYLDVELGDNTSFEIIDSIENYNSQIIFVTSYKDYALEAIRYSAADYILKPIKTNDLIAATSRAIQKIKIQNNNLSEELKPVKFVALPSIGKIDMIPVDTIIYCEAEGKYTRFFMENGDSMMSSRNLGEYEKLLVNNSFFRIHHQYLVNLEKIVRINKAAGNYCELVNDMALPIAKRRYDDLCKYLKIKKK